MLLNPMVFFGSILEEFKSKKQDCWRFIRLSNNALKATGTWVWKSPFWRLRTRWLGTHEEDESCTPIMSRWPVGVPIFYWYQKPRRWWAKRTPCKQGASSLWAKFSTGSGSITERYTGDKENRPYENGMPGSPCTEKFLVSNTEFSEEPICTASHTYQKKKIEQLQSLNLTLEEYEVQLKDVLAKECLCIGLSNAAIKTYDLKPFKKLEAVNICPGPNIAYFEEIVSLQKILTISMAGKHYTGSKRPHMFIKELMLYVDYWVNTTEQRDQLIPSEKHTWKISMIIYWVVSPITEIYRVVNEEFTTLRDK